jgi:hypothetical protein
MSKTTLDLSTLSDITDGTHTVKVKAKADGYRDSEFSNEVNYTKAPSSYTGTISNIGEDAAYAIDNGTEVEIKASSTVTLTAKSDQQVYIYNRSGGDFCKITNSSGVNVIKNSEAGVSVFSPIANNFTVTIRPS